MEQLNDVNSLFGFKIIEDINMVEYYTEEVKLSWVERIFTFKWFTKYKTIHKSKPKSEVMRWEDKLIMHPETLIQLQNK